MAAINNVFLVSLLLVVENYTHDKNHTCSLDISSVDKPSTTVRVLPFGDLLEDFLFGGWKMDR